MKTGLRDVVKIGSMVVLAQWVALGPVVAQPPQPSGMELADDPRLRKVIEFPAQFTQAEFLDLLASSIDMRIVAPVLKAEDVAKLNASLAGRKVMVSQAAEALLKLALPGEMRTTRVPFAPDIIPFPAPANYLPEPAGLRADIEEDFEKLNFILSFSKEQIDKMYLDGSLTAKELSGDQQKAYIKLLRSSGIFEGLAEDHLGTPEQARDEDVLKIPLKFALAYTASVQLMPELGDGDDFPYSGSPAGVFDYGRGLLWDTLTVKDGGEMSTGESATLEPASWRREPPAAPSWPSASLLPIERPRLRLAADNAPVAQPENGEANAPGQPLRVEKAAVFTLAELRPLLEKASGKRVIVPTSLQDVAIVLTHGTYTVRDFEAALPYATGIRWMTEGDAIALRNQDRLELKKLALQETVEKVKQRLKRLSFRTGNLPFSANDFRTGREQKFKDLSPTQQRVVLARLESEHGDLQKNVDLQTRTISFRETFWFDGWTVGEGMANSYRVQLW